MRYILEPEQLPYWFKYPKEYLRLVQQGLYHFTPWLCSAKMSSGAFLGEIVAAGTGQRHW